MSVWEIVEDDFGYYQAFAVTYSTGGAFDLTGYDVVLEVWSGEGVSRVLKGTINGSVSATPSTGVVSFQMVAEVFDTPGEWYFHIKMTQAGVEAKTDTYTVRVIEGAS